MAVLTDAQTVIGVGQIAEGGYTWEHGSQRPHRLPMKWLRRDDFEFTEPIDPDLRIVPLDDAASSATEIEASLLACRSPEVHLPAYSGGTAPSPADSAETEPEASIDLGQPLFDTVAESIRQALERKYQVILYGPPGTGKTWYAQRVAEELIARRNFGRTREGLGPRQLTKLRGDGDEPGFLSTCTFHPAYGYEDFIEGFRPKADGFVQEDGIFRRIVKAARTRKDKLYVLIIDEINRGQIPRIFGELITLLEPSRRGQEPGVRLPLSGDWFMVPANLYVIGTMNTADRSVLLLDAALRRRFAFRELMPNPALLADGRIMDVALSTWLRALNRRIVDQLGRDGRNLQVGHAYFFDGNKPAATMARIRDIVRDEIWPLLQEYCYEDPDKLSAILAGGKKGIFDPERGDLRHELFEPGREAELASALVAIITEEDRQAAVTEDEDDGDDVGEDPPTGAAG